ncbi:hypothetical protein O181_121332 [Austropuccinia psidii MF-1]|uniref:Uncharacterized protein n=1 Tax=Austropuccinia psidii MF-1 TaxID=1389203 RepID=A0A9Q3Q3B9_9BASI|nr:hypothetical protein [Austropuccinia psidii MF-1]
MHEFASAPRLIYFSAYHAYSRATPSRYASNATITHPYPFALPLTPPFHLFPQPSLRFCTPDSYSLLLTMLTLLH